MLIKNWLQRTITIAFTTLLVFFNGAFFGQENEKKRDSTSTTFSFNKLDLPDPDSIESKYEYDPQSNKYKYSQSIDGYSIRYPLYLTPTEFEALVQKEQMRDYFKEKENALNGKGADAEEKRKRLLPIFYVNSNFFESVFGGKEIEIIPQGSVEVDLGLLFNKQDNPSFSPRNQSNFTFDFDQRISLSLQGNIGTRLSVLANFDTESTFDFQNQLKLEYNPTEDAIIRAIEVGNVNFPLNSSLIQGSQSLFGVKGQFQFGKTTITGVFSEQRSDTRRVTVQGSGTIEDYELFALDYDENRHYFLSHYFRDTYDESLERYPFINSNVQITRIQVWVTNRTNNTRGLTNARNLVAIQDLGESLSENIGFSLDVAGDVAVDNGLNITVSNQNTIQDPRLPDNGNNRLDPERIGGADLRPSIRDIAFVQDGFSNFPNAEEGLDYSILENARLLTDNQYTLNTQLGYISLNQRLNNDEVLAVAYQYTKNGQVFQVGEFANDGVANTQTDGQIQVGNGTSEETQSASPTQNLIVKTLKSSVTSVTEPVWDLMMKNIYSLGVFRLEQDDFRMNIFFTDPSPVNFIKSGDTFLPTTDELNRPIDQSNPNTLLQLFNFDRLNINNDPINGGDGFFDFVPGLTVDTENGRIIFTKVEPFGEYLFDRLGDNGTTEYDTSVRNTWNANQQEFVFDRLYTETKTRAEQLQADKNKFQLKGRYKTSGQNGISIGAFNVPRGSVTVTAGGRVLQEGVDYTVNYQLGRVEILDPALLASNTPIDIATENNAVFGQQTKRYIGVNVEHKFSKDFVLGATYLNLRERPLTQKSNLDFEPINNTILGINGNYSTEVPFLTRLVNKLPNIDTEAPSNFSIRGEFAYLFAGAPNAADFEGQVTSYIDDFEGAQTRIDVGSPLQWELSSVPEGFEGASATGVETGFRRSALSWYTIDQVFYSRQRPSGVSESDLSRPQTRRIFSQEIFPNRQIAQNQTRALFPLDVHYRPAERGPYNYAENLRAAEDNFGGITRALTTTNFEQSNIEFIEFWVLNPYTGSVQVNNDDGTTSNFQNVAYMNETNVGQIRFNIGNISEDVLADGRKQYENGLPEVADSNIDTQITSYGRVPTNQSLVYAFDTEGGERAQQDAGFDGLKNTGEQEFLRTLGPTIDTDLINSEDPSGDDYQYFLQAPGPNIEDRYRFYNGTDGDSPTEVSQTDRGRSGQPTAEDVNRDNTMNRINQYFEYTVDIDPNRLTPETNPLIFDTREFVGTALDGTPIQSQWIQFRIPLSNAEIRRPGRTGTTDVDRVRRPVGGSVDLRSARFMRMYLTGFTEETLLRFGTLDLVRGNYRNYVTESGNGVDTEGINEQPVLNFSSSSISIEENEGYVTPPGIVREQLNNNNTIIQQDERSLAITVDGLRAQDARAVSRNFTVDMRQYENIEMFLHAESLAASNSQNGDLTAIVRLGNDFTENFYQIELPLAISETNNSNPDIVWPDVNRLNVPLSLLQEVKAKSTSKTGIERQQLVFFDENANEISVSPASGGEVVTPPTGEGDIGRIRVGIKGNPSFGNVRVIMLGVKNGKGAGDVSGQVWFNELRLSGLKNQGGWAAVANIDANIADFANLTVTGRRSTVGFGGIEQGPNERSQEDVAQYDFTTSVNVGQLLPKKWGVKIPVTYSRGEELITPQYDPLDQDLILQDVLDASPTKAERDRREEQSTDYTKRQSVSVIGLRKERTGDKKPRIYDVENFTFSSTYNQTDHRDFEIKKSIDQSFNLNGTYNFSLSPLEISPFKKIKYLDKKSLKFIHDFNINPIPSTISFTSGINRSFNEQEYRDVTLGAGNIGPESLQQRNYLFDWQYAVGFNLTKSLNLNINATSNRIVRNFINESDEIDRSNTIWDGLSDTGIPNQLNQSVQLNYELPFKKFPGLGFIQSSYSYAGNFQWQKGSEVFRGIVDETSGNTVDLGNTIQNSGVHQLNSTFSLDKLYKEIGLVKRKSNTRKKKKKKKKNKEELEKTLGPKIAPRTIENRKKKTNSKKLKPSIKAYNTFVGLVTALKRVTLNYQRDSGTVLPGYTNDIGFFGTLQPTPGFTFGRQADVRAIAARDGFLTNFQEFNGQYQNRTSDRLDFRGTIDLLPGLKVDVTANRSKAETYSENFRIEDGNQFISLTPNTFGNFSISSLLIKTAFQGSSEDRSKAFDDFKKNRLIVANRLAGGANTPRGTDQDGNPTAFPDGFGPNNQAVLLPAFLAAYSGKSADKISKGAFRDIPLPNWNIRYTGLIKKKWFKKRFKRFSLNHAYQSNYTINQFQSNLNFNNPNNPSNRDESGNFINATLLGNINLTEQFSPLIKVDLETKSSVKVSTEIRRDRALSFSFDNSLLTEVQGQEYVVGLGYRIKDISFATRLGTGKKRVIKSDLNLKADISLRQNQTIIRNLEIDNSQVTSGQSIFSIRFTSDYALSKNLTALFFYDHTFSRFEVSTAFPQTNIRSGFTLRYNFGN